MPQRTFKIITLGCKVNQSESAYLEERLRDSGWIKVLKSDQADVTIINTCIVTNRASSQSRQAIRKAIKENPSGLIAAVGCYAQVSPEELSRIKGIGLLAGNLEKGRLPDILLKGGDSGRLQVFLTDFRKMMSFEHLLLKGFSDRTRAFLKIQDGCESFCSYCIIPFARGPLRSLEPSKVIRALLSLCDNDYKEVVLTGVHLGMYGVDLKGNTDLKGLVRMIGKEKLPLRIRLSSLEPTEIDQDLIDMMASKEWLCRHFHISLQSGDDLVLKKMNRHYTSKEFEGLVRSIHLKIPLAAIGLDIMAGFPGEGDAACRNTYSLIRDLPVSYLHVFPFSPRKGTSAAGFPGQIGQNLIRKRAKMLRELGREKREAFLRSCLGEEVPVLAEGWHPRKEGTIKGFSDNYLSVVFRSSYLVKNRILKVRLEQVANGIVLGTPLSSSF
jgi:threonylcarbamoyladenosine tRNA methylthiotransferase MtaB